MDWYVISVFRTDFTGDRAQAHHFDEAHAKALMNASHGAYAAVPTEIVDRLVACTSVSVDFTGRCEVRESLHVA